ncbi:Sap30p TDEL_0B00820 [Torulaspora delbrueckii]|uniref:Histone deacetylase complex subunit SAP30 Sin3 binding domain-containing protein n=1 Tax=Torulaspora delbrueckii TaxID=4950 RepID=G8ZNL7_TORDE|nr:hypothetical protein TDEL_0B00820 [Torulaspora delbrueckii]CCE90211.1 hypothetical protein TDEL_0B00820 [Torulaspora delbrueckii]
MARNGNSNSESESRTRVSNVGTVGTTASAASRSNVKQRLTAAQQQYLRDLTKKNITNNHPDLTMKPGPVDFESYSDEFLRRYKDHYGIDARDNMTLSGYLLGSQIGSRTYSYRQNHSETPHSRIAKRDLASQVSKHFTAHTVKEADCIPQFIYKVKNQKRRFRMEFKG